jgi:GntR family transcriptional repressor for pyruvate dehydrogenase complex
MYDMLRQGVFYNRQMMLSQNTTRDAILDQHRAINAALQARNPEAARQAVAAHLDFVEVMLANMQRKARNEMTALQRLVHQGKPA